VDSDHSHSVNDPLGYLQSPFFSISIFLFIFLGVLSKQNLKKLSAVKIIQSFADGKKLSKQCSSKCTNVRLEFRAC
jgi:hypothetical protein